MFLPEATQDGVNNRLDQQNVILHNVFAHVGVNDYVQKRPGTVLCAAVNMESASLPGPSLCN